MVVQNQRGATTSLSNQRTNRNTSINQYKSTQLQPHPTLRSARPLTQQGFSSTLPPAITTKEKQ